jgi:hypothetical protein
MAAKMGHDKVKMAGTTVQHLVQVAVTADANRLVPLAQGHYVYYHDPITLKCHHLKVPSVEFIEAVRPACEAGLGPRLRRELEEFKETYPKNGWGLVLDSLVEEELVV